ncbi:MAG: prolyl oligopeptidase family serine peptidase [Acidimicrobiales bacterium]
MRRLVIALLACIGLVGFSISPADAELEADANDHYVDETTLPFNPVEGFEDSDRQWGVHQGAGYRYEVPSDWNGELVIWAHGYRGEENRLYFNPEEVPMRVWLLENGYAWAASTYSQNSYSTGNAVTDTRKLGTLFRQSVDRPERVYIAGASMGGHITAASIERHPEYYDGAMPVCGVVGDFELFDYFLDYGLAAQQLAFGESSFPIGPDFLASLPEIKAEFEAVEGGWPFLLNEKGEAFKQLTELRSGGDRPNFDEAWAFWNSGDFLFGLAVGDGTFGTSTKVAVTNRDVYYETDLIPGPSNAMEEALNEDIERVNLDRNARRLYRGAASVPLRGTITMPVMSLHNLGDLFVPFHNEVVYHDKVASHGKTDLLVQRAIRGTGHCEFSTAEYEESFSDLVDWVETGVKPEGDVVNDPAAVAAADYGCQFTDPTPGAHPFGTPCDDGEEG